MVHLTDEELSLIANDGVDIAEELVEEDKFDYQKFECYYTSWEEENDEMIDDWKHQQINTKISVLTDFLKATTPDEFQFNQQFKSLERKSTIN